MDLPVVDGGEVTDVELAVFADAANPNRLWRLALGDRAVEMDTLGDRVYLATSDGFVASLDIDPCGLDWVTSVEAGVQQVVSINHGVFVVSDSGLALLDRIEGTSTSFALVPGRHQMAAGPDVLAVSNGAGILLYDYLTQQASSLDIGDQVGSLASAGPNGLAIGHGITVELRTWLGAAVWARDMPDAVAAVAVVDGAVVAELATGHIVVLDDGTGDVRWEKSFAPGSSVSVGPVDHGELHILEIDLGVAARHHHLMTQDGAPVFISESPALQTFAEYDDAFILIVSGGDVTARSLLEQDLWTITTGADGLGRFTRVDVTAGLIVALSHSAERF